MPAPRDTSKHGHTHTHTRCARQPDSHVQEHEHVLVLAQQEEAGGHGLAPGDGVALGGAGAHHLEVLLCRLEQLGAVGSLALEQRDDGLLVCVRVCVRVRACVRACACACACLRAMM
jgi:hypothetical protein